MNIYHRYFDILMFSMLTIIVIGSLVLGYFYFLDGTVVNKVAEWESYTLRTERAVYKSGELVNDISSLCKYRPIRGKVQWSLVDSWIRAFPERDTGSVLTGCWKDKMYPVEVIPNGTTPGKYYFIGKLTYQVNGIREISYEFRTTMFDVK